MPCRKDRSLLHLICEMDAIMIKIVRAPIVYVSQQRLCRHLRGTLKPAQIDISFIEAAGCFDIMGSTFREGRGSRICSAEFLSQRPVVGA